VRLRPQNNIQWFGVIFALIFLACMVCMMSGGVISAVGPLLSVPVREGENRWVDILASGSTFLICILPSMLPFLIIGGWLLLKAVNPMVSKARVERPEVIISKEG
jgi:hypothetical protein